MAYQNRGQTSRAAAGNAMLALHGVSLSKNDPRLKTVKKCVDHVIKDVFQGHATVQLAGSTAKGTAVRDKSDWDFFVHLDATIPSVTQQQRMQVVHMLQQTLPGAGIKYEIRIAEKRLQLRRGSYQGYALPDADVVFEIFKGRNLTPPNSSVLAHSNAGQLVSRYLRNLPNHFQNLPPVKRVDDLVVQVDNHLRCQQGMTKAQLQGAAGFDKLLTAVLNSVAGAESTKRVKKVQAAVQNAGMATTEWRNVARRVLNLRSAGHGWPGL